MNGSFETLSTECFRKLMRPHAIEIYQRALGATDVMDLREDGVKVHVLDKEFGIDSLIEFESGQWISVQEKYRANDYLVKPWLRLIAECPDFTQEYLNAAGTQYEAPGEWFKLGAQLYFYGWANSDNTGFAAWLILNIPRYKLLVETNGGLAALGDLYRNKQHGAATFYCIPVVRLKPAVLVSHGLPCLEKRPLQERLALT